MNEKVLKTLEYNKILNQLSEYACSPDEGCIKPSVPLWKPLIFRRAQCQ